MGSEASTLAAPQPLVPTPVLLHVYDLGENFEVQALNAVLGALGTGAFHCGVEVYGHEFSFNYKSEGSGVFKCPPRSCPGHTYRTSVEMGFTTLTPSQVDRILNVLKHEWPGTSYHILENNCCAFSDAFCRALGVGPIPMWTRNLAGAGAAAASAYKVVVGVPLTLGAAMYAVGEQLSQWDPTCSTRQKREPTQFSAY
mmetsp:Transcript_134504/g.335561  ORF Transcript_134504/g.335561 Transcript_134504/m.335561 type:complete len:198 (-) Transcript_134504:134-727(-)